VTVIDTASGGWAGVVAVAVAAAAGLAGAVPGRPACGAHAGAIAATAITAAAVKARPPDGRSSVRISTPPRMESWRRRRGAPSASARALDCAAAGPNLGGVPPKRTRSLRDEPTVERTLIDNRVVRTLLHDLASPLAAIRLSAWTLLSTGTLSPGDAAIVRRIERSSRKLVGTVQTMLRVVGPPAPAHHGGGARRVQAVQPRAR
jgi:hypothetical protein